MVTRPTAPTPRASRTAAWHAVQVLGGATTPGTGAHVRSLAAGLVARGLRVTVCAPPETETRHHFTGAGAEFVPAPPRGARAFAALRAACAGADLVHAHGVRAGVLAVLALGRRRRHVPLIVTWHRRTRHEGRQAVLARLREEHALRAASVVLGTSTGLVDLARVRGARDARLVSLPAVLPPRPAVPPAHSADGDAPDHAARARTELCAADRALVLSIGPLEPGGGQHAALSAARTWRTQSAPPLLALAGEGSERAALQARIDAEDLPARLLGRRGDLLDLLAVADLALLPAARTEGGHILLEDEARGAGVPLLVAGRDVAADDPAALARAVTAHLTARPRATGDETVAHVLSVYDEFARPAS